MTDIELDEMILKIRSTTTIGRLNIAECRNVFRALEAHGYTITKTPPVTAEASDAT